jgi:CDP-paratose synthetase
MEKNILYSTRILVTGATGFIGSHLLPKLSSFTIKIVVRKYTNVIDREKQIVINDNEYIQFKNAVELFNPNIVIHLAGCITYNTDAISIKDTIDSNILFTSLLLNALKNTDVKYFVNTGTGAEYSVVDGTLDPPNLYAASKTASRYIIKYYKNVMGFKVVNVIPYVVYGGLSKSKKAVDYIIDSLDSIVPIEMTGGEQILDFTHVDDLIDFYIYCIEHYEELVDETDYHVGTGEGTTLRELAVLIEKISGKKTNIHWGGRSYRELEVMKAVAPLDNMNVLGWYPKINLEQGLTKLLKKYYLGVLE